MLHGLNVTGFSEVRGPAEVLGTLDVSAGITAASITVSGGAAIGGAASVAGHLSVASGATIAKGAVVSNVVEGECCGLRGLVGEEWAGLAGGGVSALVCWHSGGRLLHARAACVLTGASRAPLCCS